MVYLASKRCLSCRVCWSATDPSPMPGWHWICIYVKNRRGEYLESFGRRPNSVYRTLFEPSLFVVDFQW